MTGYDPFSYGQVEFDDKNKKEAADTESPDDILDVRPFSNGTLNETPGSTGSPRAARREGGSVQAPGRGELG